MAKVYDWVKLLLDNKWLVMLCFTGISSMATNAAQFVANSEYEKEDKAKTEQIAMIANHYTKTANPKIVIKKSLCGKCDSLILNHEREYHQ